MKKLLIALIILLTFNLCLTSCTPTELTNQDDQTTKQAIEDGEITDDDI